MKFSETYKLLKEQEQMISEMPHVGSPDGDFDVGLELLKGDKESLIDKLTKIFSGEPVESAHGEMTLQLETPEEKEEFKQELLDSIVFVPYVKKYFDMGEEELTHVIDNAMYGLAMAEQDKVTRDNTHDRDGVNAKLDQHYLKPEQDLNAISHMSRDFGSNKQAWEDVKKEDITYELEELDFGKLKHAVTRSHIPNLFNKEYRQGFLKDITNQPEEDDEYHDTMTGLAHKHQDVGQRVRDTGEIPIDDYYTSPEYREKMREILADVLGNEEVYNKVMSNPEKKRKFSTIYKHFKNNVKGGLSGVLKAIGIEQPAFLQNESTILEGSKIFGITIDSIENKIKEVLKVVAEEALDRTEQTLPHKYPEEAEKEANRLLRNGDIVGWVLHKGAERAIDSKDPIEKGIKSSIIMLSRRIEYLLEEHDGIHQIISYMSALSKNHIFNFIEKSYDKNEPEWVIFYMAVLQQMEDVEKVSPSAHTFSDEDDE